MTEYARETNIYCQKREEIEQMIVTFLLHHDRKYPAMLTIDERAFYLAEAQALMSNLQSRGMVLRVDCQELLAGKTYDTGYFEPLI